VPLEVPLVEGAPGKVYGAEPPEGGVQAMTMEAGE
jgi:hypothetical protein